MFRGEPAGLCARCGAGPDLSNYGAQDLKSKIKRKQHLNRASKIALREQQGVQGKGFGVRKGAIKNNEHGEESAAHGEKTQGRWGHPRVLMVGCVRPRPRPETPQAPASQHVRGRWQLEIPAALPWVGFLPCLLGGTFRSSVTMEKKWCLPLIWNDGRPSPSPPRALVAQVELVPTCAHLPSLGTNSPAVAGEVRLGQERQAARARCHYLSACHFQGFSLCLLLTFLCL